MLLYKGTITLKDSNPDEAIRVEFKHMINRDDALSGAGSLRHWLGVYRGCLIFCPVRGSPHSQSMELYKPTIQPMRQSLFHFQCITARRIRDGTIKRTVHPVFDNITQRGFGAFGIVPDSRVYVDKGYARWVLSMKDLETFWTKTRGQAETG